MKMQKTQHFIKTAEDYVVGVFCMVVFLPLIIVLSILIKLTSAGPVFFKEYRRGLNGDLFTIYKFRSFYIDEKINDALIKKREEYYYSKPTPIGSIIRKIGLDELPQFLNVIQGTMSIIGPRPNSIADDDYYAQYIENLPLRYQIKPGITGWAQINDLKGITPSIEEMKKRIEYDFYYMNNWSFLFDLKIIYLTIKYMAKKISFS